MKLSKTITATLVFMLMLSAPVTGKAQSNSGRVDLTYAADKAINTVVYIKVKTKSKTKTVPYQTMPFDPFGFDDFFGDFFGRGGGSTGERQIQVPERRGAGSGVILTSDGYIVTNNHVVEEADELQVKTSDNHEYAGRIIGTDKATDLALIKIEATGLQAATVGNSEKLKVGEWVLAIGNPYGLTSTVTAGIISAKARGIGSEAHSMESFIQTDAAINPGNSGGALVNAQGELIGINAMLVSQTGAYSGYGFAIPTTIMNKVVSDLRKYGTVQRAVLGISGTDVSNYLDVQKEKGKETDLGTVSGIYVNEVSSDGSVSDILQSGDVLTSIGGTKIDKMSELYEQLAKYNPGDKVTIGYIRDKKNHTATLTLKNAQGTTSAVETVDVNDLGVALRPLTDKEMRELNLKYGLVVSAVKKGKMQEQGITKGIIITKVNDREMHKLQDFEEVVKETNMSTDRVLWIRAKTPSGLNRSFTVDLSQGAQ